MTIRRHRRDLTDAQAAAVRRAMWFELRRVGASSAFIGAMFRVSDRTIRLGLAEGYPDEDLDEDLARAATRGIAERAHLIPDRYLGGKPRGEGRPKPPRDRPMTALEAMRAERRSMRDRHSVNVTKFLKRD